MSVDEKGGERIEAPLRPALSSEHYTDARFFELERLRIFGRLWCFVGLKMMVSKPGSYFARDLAGTPVVLQNVGGEIGVYENVCPHRGATIQPEGVGRRGFVCGYHGMRFGTDGCVEQIPDEGLHFRYDACTRSALRVRRLPMRIVGELVFTSLGSSPIAFEEQFDAALIDTLAELTSYFDTDVVHYTVTNAYDWKLAGENLRDLLHPRFVHPRSLAPIFDFEQRGRTEPTADGDRVSLRELSFGGPEGVWKSRIDWPYWEDLDRWPGATDHYFNWLVYPNLHIASPDGCRTFGIEHYDPITTGRTRLHHMMLTSRRVRPIEHGDAILRGLVRGARTVLDEDAHIMQLTQRGLSTPGARVHHGQYEARIWQMNAVYESLLHG